MLSLQANSNTIGSLRVSELLEINEHFCSGRLYTPHLVANMCASCRNPCPRIAMQHLRFCPTAERSESGSPSVCTENSAGAEVWRHDPSSRPDPAAFTAVCFRSHPKWILGCNADHFCRKVIDVQPRVFVIHHQVLSDSEGEAQGDARIYCWAFWRCCGWKTMKHLWWVVPVR